MKSELKKYPRTPHIEGSGLSDGDEDLDIVPFHSLRGKHLVVEEKQDGANTGISFDEDGSLLLQCRGHYLIGGDWPEFDQFKTWANTFQNELFDILEDRYIMYGEWMAAFHSVYYDNLPHLFMEFDIFDKKEEVFLDTSRRHDITSKCKIVIEPVRVITTKKFDEIDELVGLIVVSPLITDNAVKDLYKLSLQAGLSEAEANLFIKLNANRTMEGLYIKWEEDGIVKGRYKYVRPDFVQTIIDYGSHWTDRKTIWNKLAEGRQLFEWR
ncbi:MAG: RNA ligase family protein [Synergistaceae bacterium]